MARRLATICRYINDNAEKLRITATIQKSWSNTDRQKPRGLRYRIHEGKGRNGFRLQVFYTPTGEKVLDHDSSETYRSNDEVERWLTKWEEGYRPKMTWGNELLEPLPKGWGKRKEA